MTLDHDLPSFPSINHRLWNARPNLILASDARGALIANGPYCCDLILPGAFLGIHQGFRESSLQTIGQVQLKQVVSFQAKQQALCCRIDDIKALQRILKMPTRHQRACLLINLLCRRIGLAAVRDLPAEIMAKIVASSPAEITAARHRYETSLTTLASKQRMSDRSFLDWQRRLYE